VAETVYELAYDRGGTALTNTLPAVVIDSITPVGTEVDLDGEVVITFSTAMDTSADGTVVLQPDSGESIQLDPTEGLWSENDTVYTIPYSDLALGTEYTIDITGFRTADVKSRLDSDDVSFRTVDSYEASIDPTSKDFGTVVAGDSPPAPQQFTITNEGTGILTGLAADIIGDDSAAFDITAGLSSLTINPNDAATISVQPVAGLTPRNTPYEATLHITGANNILFDIPLSILVTDSFKLTIDPPTYDFGDGEQGYAPSRHTFTITNTGTGMLSDLDVFLGGSDISSFALTSTPSSLSTSALSPLATHSLAPGQSLTVEAYPIEGLAPRDTPYTALLRVTASDSIDVSVPLSFTVKASSGGGGGGNSGDGGGGTTPKTGDAAPVLLAALALSLAILGALIAIALRQRRRMKLTRAINRRF
jgi:LPXTG-motif cell wall-anchored protein